MTDQISIRYNPNAGHKILLSTAVLRTSQKLTVGVTSPCLLGRKTLTELIEPLDTRIKAVKDFINIVDGKIEQNVVEIEDPFGPAIVDPTLQVRNHFFCFVFEYDIRLNAKEKYKVTLA